MFQPSFKNWYIAGLRNVVFESRGVICRRETRLEHNQLDRKLVIFPHDVTVVRAVAQKTNIT